MVEQETERDALEDRHCAERDALEDQQEAEWAALDDKHSRLNMSTPNFPAWRNNWTCCPECNQKIQGIKNFWEHLKEKHPSAKNKAIADLEAVDSVLQAKYLKKEG